MTETSLRDRDAAGPDRRAFMTGLGVAAITVAFAPIPGLVAPAAAAAPVAAPPVTAVFWGLPYNDFTGVTPAYKPARRTVAAALRDADPHAELLGRG
jgi:hypothetical protein